MENIKTISDMRMLSDAITINVPLLPANLKFLIEVSDKEFWAIVDSVWAPSFTDMLKTTDAKEFQFNGGTIPTIIRRKSE